MSSFNNQGERAVFWSIVGFTKSPGVSMPLTKFFGPWWWSASFLHLPYWLCLIELHLLLLWHKRLSKNQAPLGTWCLHSIRAWSATFLLAQRNMLWDACFRFSRSHLGHLRPKVALAGHELPSTPVEHWVELKWKNTITFMYLASAESWARKGVQHWTKADLALHGTYREIIKT